MVQSHGHVAGHMRKVESCDSTNRMGCFGDGFYIKELTGIVIDAAEQYQRQAVFLFFNGV